LAQEAALDKPDSNWENLLKQMITRARQKSLQWKLSLVMKGGHQSLDYTEEQDQKWFHTTKLNELYEFNEGCVSAHGRSPHAQMAYHHGDIFKVLPSNVKVVDVELTADECARITTSVAGRTNPTWTQITKEAEIEKWLCRHNNCHHHQAWNDRSPPPKDHSMTSLVNTGPPSLHLIF